MTLDRSKSKSGLIKFVGFGFLLRTAIIKLLKIMPRPVGESKVATCGHIDADLFNLSASTPHLVWAAGE